MKTKVSSVSELLLNRCEELMTENFRLQKELAREKEINHNYWSSIVWMRSSDCMKINAKPCPFCDGRHVGLEGSTCDSKWFIMCDCGTIGPEADSEAEAIRLWNQAARKEDPCEC